MVSNNLGSAGTPPCLPVLADGEQRVVPEVPHTGGVQMFVVLGRFPNNSSDFIVTDMVNGKTTSQFETTAEAQKAATRNYRSNNNATGISGKPTIEATYTVLDLNQAVAVASITPPPDLMWSSMVVDKVPAPSPVSK